MVSKREKVYSFRLSEKNKVYLKTLKFIDGRTLGVRKDGPDLSKFVNECVTFILENEMSRYSNVANAAELSIAYHQNEIQKLKRLTDNIQEEWKRNLEQIRISEDEQLKYAKKKMEKDVQR